MSEKSAPVVPLARSPWPFSKCYVLLAVLVAAALLRIIALSAFPEVQADEGLWTNSAKNFVEFGDWFMDGRTHLFLSPLFNGLAVVSFWIAGPSIAAARLISAVAGVAAVGLLYGAVARAVGDRHLALVASILFGFDPWPLVQSRAAMIESLQVALCLAAVYLAVGARRWSSVFAGFAFGLALLAKMNVIFLALVLAVCLAWRSQNDKTRSYLRPAVSVFAFLGVAFVVAGTVYGALYLTYPERFVQGFRFELDGAHFEKFAHPLIRVGRFGLDPRQAARTLMDLVREAPFLMVLAALGAGAWSIRRLRGSGVFALWLIVGFAFYLGQIYQPPRYFLLLSPALAFAAAVALVEFGRATAAPSLSTQPLTRVAVAICVAFDLLYLGASAVTNRAHLLPTLVPWVTSHIPRDAPVMAAGYFCTDLPNRAYADYWLAGTPEQLLWSIRRLRIRYLIVDRREWAPEVRAVVAQRFGPPMQTWSFGAVYAIHDSALNAR